MKSWRAFIYSLYDSFWQARLVDSNIARAEQHLWHSKPLKFHFHHLSWCATQKCAFFCCRRSCLYKTPFYLFVIRQYKFLRQAICIRYLHILSKSFRYKCTTLLYLLHNCQFPLQINLLIAQSLHQQICQQFATNVDSCRTVLHWHTLEEWNDVSVWVPAINY